MVHFYILNVCIFTVLITASAKGQDPLCQILYRNIPVQKHLVRQKVEWIHFVREGHRNTKISRKLFAHYTEKKTQHIYFKCCLTSALHSLYVLRGMQSNPDAARDTHCRLNLHPLPLVSKRQISAPWKP